MGTVFGQPSCKSHAWQVERGGIWGLSSTGNSLGLINRVRPLQGPACFSQWIWVEHFLCARHSVNRDKTQSLSSEGFRMGTYMRGWGHMQLCHLLFDLAKPPDLAELRFLICKMASHVLLSCDETIAISVHRLPGADTQKYKKYLQPSSSPLGT